jgi:tetratricopeptide (TPR) repeat protein
MPAEWEQYQAAGEEALKEGDFAAAEIMWRAALELSRAFNKLDPRITITLEGLAEALYHQGRFAEAEPLCRRALELFKVTRGPDHPDVGVTANNLAMLYKQMGKYKESEDCYKQGIGVLTKTLGMEHPDVINILAKYAELLRLTGRDQEAEDLKVGSVTVSSPRLTRSGQYQTVTVPPEEHLTFAEIIADDSDKTTWDMCRQAAERAMAQGDYGSCESLWQAALKRAENFEEQDPRLATTLESIAEVLFKQALYDQAEHYAKLTLEIYEKMLGPDHQDVGIMAGNLAQIFHAQKKYADAEAYYRQALPIRQSRLGVDHAIVMALTMNYAHLLITTGRAKEANELRLAATTLGPGRWTRSGSYQVLSIPEGEKLHLEI